jgi:hypothetical protein
MTNEPTPETDAEMSYRPPTAQPWYVPYEFARALEIQRNEARAERDEHIARNNDSLLALHLTTAERDEARADVARLRDVLQRIVNNGGSATNEMLFDARTALAQ